MNANNNVLNSRDPKEISAVALKAFFNITQAWQISSKQEMILLGAPARSTFYKWRGGTGPVVKHDTLERISHLLAIYKSLREIFPNEQQANEWPNKANQAFAQDSAINFMLKGGVSHLLDVRRYLHNLRS